jgi:hypothetical protein
MVFVVGTMIAAWPEPEALDLRQRAPAASGAAAEAS